MERLRKIVKQNKAGCVLWIVLIMLGEVLFFHNILFNDNLIGYRVDGRLVTFLTEHWYQVFLGNEGWEELPCFYPEKNVLAYSDMMLLFGGPFILLRIVGADMYTALKITVILFHVLGSYLLYYFMRKYVQASGAVSFLTVVCFSFTNGYNCNSANMQMFALSLLPVLLIAGAYYIKNLEQKKRHIAAIVAVVWLAMLFYTSFYVAYFVCLFSGIVIIVYAIGYFVLRKHEWVRVAEKKVVRHIREYMLYLLLFALCMLPFICLYLPALKDFGGRSWEEIEMLFPGWKNICMLNEKNDELAAFNPEIYNYKTGFPIIDLIIYGIAGIGICIFIFRKKRKSGLRRKEYMYLLGGIIIFLAFILILQIRGFTLWYFIYKFIPGASAIRAVIRWLCFISLPMAIFLGAVLTYFSKESGFNKKYTEKLALILSLVMFCSNYCVIGIGTGWSVSGEINFEKSVKAPPQDCKVMYVVDKDRMIHRGAQEVQLDAWAIALKFQLKTINGYSGQIPKGWDLLDITQNGTDQKVREWLELYGQTEDGVYDYDLGKNEWGKL